jgi:hypothetical protein
VHRLGGKKEILDPRTKEDIFLDLLGALWNEIASPVISALGLKVGSFLFNVQITHLKLPEIDRPTTFVVVPHWALELSSCACSRNKL